MNRLLKGIVLLIIDSCLTSLFLFNGLSFLLYHYCHALMDSIGFAFVEKFPDHHLNFAFRTFEDFFFRNINDLGFFALGAFDFNCFLFFFHPVLLKGVRVMDFVAMNMASIQYKPIKTAIFGPIGSSRLNAIRTLYSKRVDILS